MKINLTYCVNKKLIPDYYDEVLSCYGLSAKNIKNASLFIIKNIFNSYTFNKDLNIYQLKTNLHTNQQEMINLTNEVITSLNVTLKTKYDSKLKIYNDNKKLKNKDNDKDNKDNNVKDKEKEPKLIQFNEYLPTIDSQTYYQIVNKSLLDIATLIIIISGYQIYSVFSVTP